ncbi:aminoglycoside phosphotransferase family protein [Sulfitobacter sp. D35]|uniref:phosphotransferase family protein n=1 Tax=Sulfitobacter sp. D35 TaxID=3083252 RepID=UPI00296F1123|nr:aminoglycoside phosphotransferase family protein [Sulfitobacter sp. D35]MDW4499732.1 aminoglycoside phosphotransferase family protein [Sulfitobacter sp. D35]
MASDIDSRCRALVADLGLGRPGDVRGVEPLTGGVASDIARFEMNGRNYCAKFALPKLKVEKDWHVPVHRSAAEYAWLQFAAQVSPESAVRLFGRSEEAHGFIMEFITGPEVYLWKAALLEEAPDRDEARQVGDLLGILHAASDCPEFDTRAFRNRDDFRAIRIEPYLTFTASVHPDLAEPLTSLADTLYEADEVLVHGDVSPKNILFRAAGPVFLDSECATMGDRSFDPAYCLNHLLLKAVHRPGSRGRLLNSVLVFRDAYMAHVDAGARGALETRITRLLPALMLARVDGKSPVEYLSEVNRARVRIMAIDLIRRPESRLDQLVTRIRDGLAETSEKD